MASRTCAAPSPSSAREKLSAKYGLKLDRPIVVEIFPEQKDFGALTMRSRVANKEFIIDPSQVDLTRTLADIEDIRRYNPQRFEMEQLTAEEIRDSLSAVIRQQLEADTA